MKTGMTTPPMMRTSVLGVCGKMTMLAAIAACTLAFVGCGKKEEPSAEVAPAALLQASMDAQKAAFSTDRVSRYKESLTRLLEERKKRESLSYSVSREVEEEMVRFRSLSQNDQERKLEEVQAQLKDYQ